MDIAPSSSSNVTESLIDSSTPTSLSNNSLLQAPEVNLEGRSPRTMDEREITSVEIMPDALKLEGDLHALQLSKEFEVGIMEFVSPELPGFSGTLKKRSTLSPNQKLNFSLIAGA